jgi:23S rRNA pseudouridine2605 synthase
MRIQQYLARAGVASRRKAELLVKEGRVRINGVPATLGDVLQPGDRVELDGRELDLPLLRTLALYKPRGFVTTRADPHAAHTVMELVPSIPGLHPVGRLDRDSEGLLLLTNDGELTERLTHPRYGVLKTYEVWTGRELPAWACRELERGIPLAEGLARARSAQPTPYGVRLVLGEGKKREIRRMLARLGFPVHRLLRVQIGPLRLEPLQPGEWRELLPQEVEALKTATMG